MSDYLGTPIQMYDAQGNKTWDCTLDIYGKVLAVDKGTELDCPFRFQGQYEDIETGLYYNRFRYYDPNFGGYISQDPITLEGGNPTIYGYVNNANYGIDIFGLIDECEIGIFSQTKNKGNQIGNGIQRNHLNQTALFRFKREDGVVIGLRGCAFKKGTPHNIFHKHLDDFFENCKGGVTTVIKYNIELFKALRAAGVSIFTSSKGVIVALIEQLRNGVKPWNRINVGKVHRTTHH